MARQTFPPFQTKMEEISFTVTVAGQDERFTVSGDEPLNMYELGEDVIDLKISGNLDKASLNGLIDESELNYPPIDISLKIFSLLSRQRFATKLVWENETFYGDLQIKKSDWAGTLQLSIVVSRNSDGKNFDFATWKGSTIQTSGVVNVYVDPPKTPPGNTLDVQWINFNIAEDRNRYGIDSVFKDELFHIFFDGFNDPIVLINKEYPAALSLLDNDLNNRGTTGFKARLRDLVYSRIQTQGWSQLLIKSLSELKDSGSIQVESSDQNDSISINEMPDYWAKRVIEKWVKLFCPTSETQEEAIISLQDQLSEPQGLSLLVEKIDLMIQQEFSINRGLNAFYDEIQRSDEQS